MGSSSVLGTKRLESACDLSSRRDVPTRCEIARHPPALVGVDHDLELRSDRVPNRLDDLDVAAPVGVVEADLHRFDTGVAKCH